MSVINEAEALEVLQFLSPAARTDLKSVAMQYFLGLTGTEEGRLYIHNDTKYISAIVDLTSDDQSSIRKDAYLAMVNLSTEASIALQLLTLERQPQIGVQLLSYMLKTTSEHADVVCALLNNLSRSEDCARIFVELMVSKQTEIGFDKVVQAFCQVKYNPKNTLDYLGPFLANLTQMQEARKYVLDKERCVIQRLLPYTEYSDSLTRRGGVISILHNCCFEVAYHDWLLGEEVNLLPRLLLPLAGPEEFDDEDTERLPVDLQYLEPGKQRESDPDLRRMLVESVNQLCATPSCRQYIKKHNVYIIMRELDTWEKDPLAKAAVEKLIQLLIGDEPEVGMENLRTVDIPENVETQLQKSHDIEQKEIEEELRKSEEGKDGKDGAGDVGSKGGT